jgi:hypothetical protein
VALVVSIDYGFRVAHEQHGFIQHGLVDHTKFGALAKERGVPLSFGKNAAGDLERLDEAGALKPIGSQLGADLVLREEQDYVSWSEHAIEDNGCQLPLSPCPERKSVERSYFGFVEPKLAWKRHGRAPK